MPASVSDELLSAAVSVTPMSPHKSHHRRKSELGKRSRTEQDGDDNRDNSTRKHKKAKKHDGREKPISIPELPQAGEADGTHVKKGKKSRSSKHAAATVVPEEAPANSSPGMTQDNSGFASAGETAELSPKKSKRPRHSKKESHDAGELLQPDATLGGLGTVPDLSNGEHQSAKDKSSRKHRPSMGEESPTADSAPGNLGNTGVGAGRRKTKKRSSKQLLELHTGGDSHASSQDAQTTAHDAELILNSADEDTVSPVSMKKSKSEKKHKDRSEAANVAAVNPVGLDTLSQRPERSSVALQPSHAPADIKFPFFKQFLSLFVPLYPIGFSTPVTSAAEQHLAPMLNHYSPLLQGVVLGYRSPCLAEQARHSKVPANDDTPALLQSIDEYAVGFGRLTAEVDLFKPCRGAWMEGEVVLQSEGNVGIKCFERFNASIEARRLPAGWKWVGFYDQVRAEPQNGKVGQGGDGPVSLDVARGSPMQLDDEASNGENDPLASQMHVTGYWVDLEERRVRGKVRFQIKSYETGLAGDYGYISIVGTMLGEDEERKLDTQERQEKRKRHGKHGGLLRPQSRRVPEFSMTTFGREDQEESSEQRQVFSKSRLNTPDD